MEQSISRESKRIGIYSPSHKRADQVITQKWLPEATFVVAESEADEYSKKGWRVLSCPDEYGIGNIARVKNWVLDHVEDERVLLIDDDVESVSMWGRDQGSSGLNSKEINGWLLNFLEHGFYLAEEWGVKLWGVNCARDRGGYRELTPFSCKRYISGSFMGFIRPDLRFDERLRLKEDYDYCLQVLNKDRRILRFNMVFLVKADHKNVGGCAAYRTIETEKEQMEMLRKKWGTRIVSQDLGESRTRRKRRFVYDINPVIRPPIKGV